jgi:hypothetical protein
MPVALAASLLLGACNTPGAAPISSASTSAPTTLSEPSVEVRATPSPSIEPASLEPSLAQPPAAFIAVDGGDPVDGELGSFTWQNGGSDSPWLDGTPIHIGSGELLTLTLREPVGIDSWTASRVPRPGLDATTPEGLGDGASEPVTFAGPPKGTWSVNVNVWFVDNLGSASYYWLVEVD